MSELDELLMAFLSDAEGISDPRTHNSRGRPLSATTRAIREAVLYDLVPRFERMTVRQVYYQVEVAGIVEKGDRGYRQVQRQVLAMRREGLLDWEFITDGTRWRRKPESWDSIEDYVEAMQRGYRRDLWRSQGVRLEVWLEKDALADVLTDVVWKWDVSLMVSRGTSSATFLQAALREARRAWEANGTRTYVYTLYDFDKAGKDAHRTVERELAGVVPVERLAVTPAQISAWRLPTRVPKDRDRKSEFTYCVELDAIDPGQLTQLVEDAITRHINFREWEVQKTIEAEERRGLRALRNGFGD